MLLWPQPLEPKQLHQNREEVVVGEETASRRFLSNLVSSSECSVSLIKCGDDICLGRSLHCTGRCHPNQCGALARVLGGSLDRQTILQTWEAGGMVYF